LRFNEAIDSWYLLKGEAFRIRNGHAALNQLQSRGRVSGCSKQSTRSIPLPTQRRRTSRRIEFPLPPSQKLPKIALPERFVLFEDLPKMASGKTDFKRITEHLQEIIKRF